MHAYNLVEKQEPEDTVRVSGKWSSVQLQDDARMDGINYPVCSKCCYKSNLGSPVQTANYPTTHFTDCCIKKLHPLPYQVVLNVDLVFIMSMTEAYQLLGNTINKMLVSVNGSMGVSALGHVNNMQNAHTTVI